eukprot:COSAG04_NODE_15124_length_542_cov_84.212190_1_plen_72_part_00
MSGGNVAGLQALPDVLARRYYGLAPEPNLEPEPELEPEPNLEPETDPLLGVCVGRAPSWRQNFPMYSDHEW